MCTGGRTEREMAIVDMLENEVWFLLALPITYALLTNRPWTLGMSLYGLSTIKTWYVSVFLG